MYSMFRKYILQTMDPYDQSCGETDLFSCILAYEPMFLARLDIPPRWRESKPVSSLSLAQQYAAPLL
jgi:hypothetical protein